MYIRSLKVFCDLVDTQSFTKAAALNSVSQSAVSQQIRNLGKKYGKQLMEQEKRRLILTAAGEVFYRYAGDIIRHYGEMQHEIEMLNGVVSGTVRLSTIYSVGMLELGPTLRTYLKAYPEVNLHLEYDYAWQIYDDVIGRELDVGIVAYPTSHPQVEMAPFAQHRSVVICSPGHPFAERQSISIEELNRCPFIAFTEETPTRQALDELFRKRRIRPEIVMELDHIAAIKDAVEVNLGVSIVPAPSAEQEKDRGTLKMLTLEDEVFLRPLGIIYRRGRSLPTAARKLIEVLTEGNAKAAGQAEEMAKGLREAVG